MDFHQYMLIHMYTALSYLFLYFGVLTFTWETSPHNRLARVSKSRTHDTRRLVGSDRS
jgi:hypothetical protein